MSQTKVVPVEQQIERLINGNSLENESNTPDFILAQFLMASLAAFNTAIQQRETWYGRDARPSAGNAASPSGEGTAAQQSAGSDASIAHERESSRMDSPDSVDAAAPSAGELVRRFADCKFEHCDLWGQCKAEGKCHHPVGGKEATTHIEQSRERMSEAEIERLKHGEVCPDCYRFKAHTADDCAAGKCSKWYAVRDKEADADCIAFKNKTGYYATKESVERRIAELEEALKAAWHYSDHTNQCKVGNSFEDEPLCDCGYDEAALLVNETLKGVTP